MGGGGGIGGVKRRIRGNVCPMLSLQIAKVLPLQAQMELISFNQAGFLSQVYADSCAL